MPRLYAAWIGLILAVASSGEGHFTADMREIIKHADAVIGDLDKRVP
jgi:hypothetical protein